MLRMANRSNLVSSVVLACVIAFLWIPFDIYPRVLNKSKNSNWYQPCGASSTWSVSVIDDDKLVKSQLNADWYFYRQYISKTNDQEVVRFFSTAQSRSDLRDLRILQHPPDFCWVLSGWSNETDDETRTQVETPLGNVWFERRIFNHLNKSELVYFTAFVGSTPLFNGKNRYFPITSEGKSSGQNSTFFSWLNWFNRIMPEGSWKISEIHKSDVRQTQFVRVSAPILGGRVSEADMRIRRFLELCRPEACDE
jgi:hypothetical protein